MSFDKIIGQPLAVQLVQRWLAKETTQPLLFYGPDAAGQRVLAIEAAKALNCPSPLAPLPKSGEGGRRPGEDGCGSCLSCKKIEAGRHPDVRIIDLEYQAAVRGEPVEKQQSLKIETVLEERKRLYQTVGEGAWKVSILDSADKLTQDAANVLLKVMEEPPAHTAIFLLTSYRDRLFTTIVSRCQPIRFRQLSDAEKQHHTLTHEEIEDVREAEELWQKIPQMTPSQLLAKQERSRGSSITRADIETQIQKLLSPALREFRSNASTASQKKLRWIQRAQTQLKQNVPPALVYDNLLLKLSGK